MVLLLITTLVSPAAASPEYLVYDLAEVLTLDEDWALENRARAISDRFNLDVVILTLPDMEGYTDAFELAMDYYDDFEYNTNGVMLLSCPSARKVAVIAHGTGNRAFTDYGKDVILDNYLVPHLKNDDIYAAASAFLDRAEDFLARAEADNPFDRKTDPDKKDEYFWYKLLFTLFFPFFIAVMLCERWKKQMKTAAVARVADAYIPAGGFNLTGQQDQFLYRTETRTKIEKSSSSGGTTTNDRGYSGSSRSY